MKIPRNVKEALEFDKENGNSKWAEAMKLEIQSLKNLECFEFQPKDYSPNKEYQNTMLMMIMNVKQDLRHKLQKTLRDHNRAIHRITRLYDFYLDENNDV